MRRYLLKQQIIHLFICIINATNYSFASLNEQIIFNFIIDTQFSRRKNIYVSSKLIVLIH